MLFIEKGFKINATQYNSTNAHSYKVVMYMQKLHHFCNTLPMMAQDWAESTKETINYGRFINQFPLNIIRSIRQLDRIYIKICRQKMLILFNQICINEKMLSIYIYIYIYSTSFNKSRV